MMKDKKKSTNMAPVAHSGKLYVSEPKNAIKKITIARKPNTDWKAFILSTPLFFKSIPSILQIGCICSWERIDNHLWIYGNV